jgi:hypothetical protein
MSTNHTPSQETQKTKVLDFTAFKKKQAVNQEVARGRKPLYINHDEGRVSGTAASATAPSAGEDFGDRLQKIRASLDRINNLMADLKKLSAHRDQSKPH